MNQEKIAMTLLGLAAELLGKDSCCGGFNKPAPKPFAPKPQCNCGCAAHTPKPQFDREPDGVQIVVDRPRREDYYSHAKWAHDMANYRGLIDQAKKCEGIKTRKPDFIPQEVHDNRKDWYDDHGMGFNEIKSKVLRSERAGINPFANRPQGIRVEARIMDFDPNKDWF